MQIHAVARVIYEGQTRPCAIGTERERSKMFEGRIDKISSKHTHIYNGTKIFYDSGFR